MFKVNAYIALLSNISLYTEYTTYLTIYTDDEATHYLPTFTINDGSISTKSHLYYIVLALKMIV